MPTVSILVPVYKAEKTLDACVESILAQSYADFELLLIDDASPDHCPEMCDAWAEKDPRIRALHPAKTGPGAVRCAQRRAGCRQGPMAHDGGQRRHRCP